MPTPSKIETLLDDTQRAELNAKIKANGFGDYRGLAQELQDMGFEISKSAVHSHGQRLQKQVEKIRAAAEGADYLRTLYPDDDGAMTDATLRIIQAELFNYIQDLELTPGSIPPEKLARLVKDLALASISQKKLQNEMRKEMLERANSAVENGEWQRDAMEEAKRIMGFD